MEVFKRNRGPLLFPVVLLAVTLVGYVVFTIFANTASTAGHLAVGQQYLNDLNYSGAILEFTNAISIDPCNKEARIGLAKAYSGSGNNEVAADVLTDVLDKDSPDEEIADELIDIYTKSGQLGQALVLIQEMINHTDDDRYYELLSQVVRMYWQQPHSYAQGSDQYLRISNGVVESRGRNTLGQLGTEALLGDPEQEQADFAPAGFDGTALQVYCAGRTSYVVDDAHNLWAAGENRWGQMSVGYGFTAPLSGWRQITDSGDIAAVSGTTGQLLVLKTDGTLWSAGYGAEQTLKQVKQFPGVIQLCSTPDGAAILTSGGKLYYHHADEEGWDFIAQNVVAFAFMGGSLVWVDVDGNLVSQGGVNFPGDWYNDQTGKVAAPFEVCRVAASDTVLLLQGTGNMLYQIDQGGEVTELKTESQVLNLYSQMGSAVAELEDGTLMYWESGAEKHEIL